MYVRSISNVVPAHNETLSEVNIEFSKTKTWSRLPLFSYAEQSIMV